MTLNKIVHRATDYFGIAYYGFLALYAIYELFFVGEYVSIIVIEPLISTILTIGLLYIVISPIYLFVSPREDKDNPLGNAVGNFGLGVAALIAAGAFISKFITPEEPFVFIEPITMFFIFIVIVDVLLRIFVKDHSSDREKESLGIKLDRASLSYHFYNSSRVSHPWLHWVGPILLANAGNKFDLANNLWNRLLLLLFPSHRRDKYCPRKRFQGKIFPNKFHSF